MLEMEIHKQSVEVLENIFGNQTRLTIRWEQGPGVLITLRRDHASVPVTTTAWPSHTPIWPPRGEVTGVMSNCRSSPPDASMLTLHRSRARKSLEYERSTACSAKRNVPVVVVMVVMVRVGLWGKMKGRGGT